MSNTLLGTTWHGQIYSGGWRAGGGGTTSTVEPATGASLGEIGLANAGDVDDAVARARAAQPAWAATPPDTSERL